MKKILYISKLPIGTELRRGIGVGSTMQYNALSSILGKHCYLFNIPDYEKYSYRSIEVLLHHRYEGMSREIEAMIVSKIKHEQYDIIYIDNSLWGYLIKRIKTECRCSIIIFCQDIEYSRVLSILRYEWSSKQFLKFLIHQYWKWIVYKNESLATTYADKILTLNQRDSNVLFYCYGKKSLMEIPVCLEDKFKNNSNIKNPYPNPNKINLLFVGAMDYQPNIEAMDFMKKSVMPYTSNAHLYVIGKNSEQLYKKFEYIQNITIVGEVESLEPYYTYATAVIIPIFSGGGMKIKTAEALMYGKYILGTKEAFEGYSLDYSKAGALCNNAEEFIKAIGQIQPNKIYNDYSRKFYLFNHSFNVMVAKYSSIFCEELEGTL